MVDRPFVKGWSFGDHSAFGKASSIPRGSKAGVVSRCKMKVGGNRSSIRPFSEPMNLEDIQARGPTPGGRKPWTLGWYSPLRGQLPELES